MCREVLFLMEIIDKYAAVRDTATGRCSIPFGLLFQVYASYSDKVTTISLTLCHQ